MTRSHAWWVPMTLVLAVGCAAEPPGPPIRPVADVSELMTRIIDPAADAVWLAVGTVLTEEGIDEWRPETDEEWAVVENGAMAMAEGGNLLMLGDRARDNETWMRMSEALIDAGVKAYEAAQARDADEIFALGGEIYAACDQCHNRYWVGDEDRGRVRPEMAGQ